MSSPQTLRNWIGGEWIAPAGSEQIPVVNPATAETLAEAPLSSSADVGRAVGAASRAFPDWRRTPPGERIQHLFRLKALLERDFDEISATVTRECGKTLAESKGEMRRAVENVQKLSAPAVAGMDARDQSALDRALVALETGNPRQVAAHQLRGTATLTAVVSVVAAGAGVHCRY